MSVLDEFWKTLQTLTLNAALSLAITLIVGFIGIKLVNRLARRLLERSTLNAGLCALIQNSLRGVMYFVLFIICASQLNLPVSSLITILGALGLAISLALQDSLANLAGGIFVLCTKPFSIGDFVEMCGVSGTVNAIGFIHTVVCTIDNRRIYIPNGSVSKDKIINFSSEANRQLELIFPVGYHCDAALARSVIERTVSSDPRVLPSPAPFVRVWQLSASSVDIIVRAWVKNEDLIEAKCALLERVVAELDRADVPIPYPQLAVHMQDMHKQ